MQNNAEPMESQMSTYLPLASTARLPTSTRFVLVNDRVDEGRACQQNRGVPRDHRRQNGHAAGSCLRAQPTEGHVRRHAIASADLKLRVAKAALLSPSLSSDVSLWPKADA
jgi:hypothetical protein